MTPAQLCRQCLHNSAIRERFSKAHHIEKSTPSKSAPEFLNQSKCKVVHNLLAIVLSFMLQDISADAVTEAPGEKS